MQALRETAFFRGHKGAVNAVKFNADGNYCLTGGEDRRILLWNPHRDLEAEGAAHAPIKEYAAHNNRVLDIAVARDNASFASCGGDKMVFMWDVASGRVSRRLIGHEQRVNCVAYNEESSILLSGSYDKSVRCWDCRSRSTTAVQVLTQCADSVSAVISSSHEIIVGSIDGCIRTFDLRMGSLSCDSIGCPVTNVSLSRDQNCVLASSLDSTLRLIDKSTGQLLNQYTGHQSKMFKTGCCISHDDAFVLSGSEDGLLHVWDLVEARPLRRIRAHSGPLVALSCHPKRLSMLSASHDGTVKLWSTQ